MRLLRLTRARPARRRALAVVFAPPDPAPMRALALALLLAGAAHAQPFPLAPAPGTSLSVTTSAATSNESQGGGTLGDAPGYNWHGRLAVDAQIALSDGVHVVATLPIVRDWISADEGRRGSVTEVANPYVGVSVREVVSEVTSVDVEAGVWLPLLDSDSPSPSTQTLAGFATDRPTFEAYQPRNVAARVLFRGTAALTETVSVRADLAPTFAYYTGETSVETGTGQVVEFPRTNVAFTSSAFADIEAGPATITAGTTGRLEPEGGSFDYLDDLFLDAFGAVTLETLPVRPSLHLRVPMRGASASDAAIGVTLGVPIR